MRKVAALAVALSLLLLGQTASSAATPKVVATPSISTYAAVGSTVRLVHAKFSSPTKISTAWLFNGKPITGATGSTFKVTAKQASGYLQVRETAKLAGKTLIALSNKLTVGKLLVVGAVTIGYTDETNTVMKAVLPSKILPAPASISYKWLRNGFDIPNETEATHTVASSDRGAQVSVRVTINAS